MKCTRFDPALEILDDPELMMVYARGACSIGSRTRGDLEEVVREIVQIFPDSPERSKLVRTSVDAIANVDIASDTAMQLCARTAQMAVVTSSLYMSQPTDSELEEMHR